MRCFRSTLSLLPGVAGLLALSCSAGPYGVRPPCSALDPAVDGEYGACDGYPREARLTCDPDARMAESVPRIARFAYESCGKRCHLLIGPGTEEPTREEAALFAREHQIYAEALPGVRYAVDRCRHEGAAADCFSIRVDRCTGPTLDVIATHALRWAKGVDLSHKKLRVRLEIGGAERPRCEPSDPSCGPVAYDDAVYEPGGARFQLYDQNAFRWSDRDEHPCTHDGDCVQSGNDCASWVEGHPDEAASQEWRGYQEQALCGCVAARCIWFTQ